MCAKYQGPNIKTVTWAQKVNFRQKNTKKVKEKKHVKPPYSINNQNFKK